MIFEYWYWFLIAGLLFLFELCSLSGGGLFFGISSLLMGIITFFVKLNGNNQIFLSGIFSVLLLIGGYYIFKPRLSSIKKNDDCNDRMREQIGKRATLLKDNENGISKIKIGDTYWRIIIDDAKQGDIVTITDFSSTSFIGIKHEDVQ